MTGTRRIFEEQRKRIIERLRDREPELVRELESVELAIKNLGEEPTPAGVYAKYKRGIDAIVAHLQRVSRTEDKDALPSKIIKGGWLVGNANAETNIKLAIRYHLDNSEKTKCLKLFPSGRVGLFDWTEDFDEL